MHMTKTCTHSSKVWIHIYTHSGDMPIYKHPQRPTYTPYYIHTHLISFTHYLASPTCFLSVCESEYEYINTHISSSLSHTTFENNKKL